MCAEIIEVDRQHPMPRFKPDDRVFILPKYAHLYPDSIATVIGVTADTFRPTFNEYVIQFADRSTATLFEFQVIEDLAKYQTHIASVVFDSDQQTANIETRGHSSSRQIILQTPQYDVDIGISKSEPAASITGQVLRRETKETLSQFNVALLRESMPIFTTMSDAFGVFNFRHVPHGSLNILFTIHRYFYRILGAFSI